MKDDIARLREMSEDTLRVLEVAEQMVNSTYQRLCGLLHESEQENNRLRKRVEELELLLGSKQETAIVHAHSDDTQVVDVQGCRQRIRSRVGSRNLAETMELK